VDVPFGGRSVRVKMFSGRSVGGRSVKAPQIGVVVRFDFVGVVMEIDCSRRY
jgi:hypothetical protein